ncbi:MAG: hypothetical protein LBU44_00270 [Mediterranea sp.]|jgi:hypothetical protein|nr:hypothetical protein [Mediterranea sp.]
MKAKIYKVSRDMAIELTMNHNCVSHEVAERYTPQGVEGGFKAIEVKG